MWMTLSIVWIWKYVRPNDSVWAAVAYQGHGPMNDQRLDPQGQGLSFKAKARTKDHEFVLMNSIQGPRPRITSLLIGSNVDDSFHRLDLEVCKTSR